NAILQLSKGTYTFSVVAYGSEVLSTEQALPDTLTLTVTDLTGTAEEKKTKLTTMMTNAAESDVTNITSVMDVADDTDDLSEQEVADVGASGIKNASTYVGTSSSEDMIGLLSRAAELLFDADENALFDTETGDLAVSIAFGVVNNAETFTADSASSLLETFDKFASSYEDAVSMGTTTLKKALNNPDLPSDTPIQHSGAYSSSSGMTLSSSGQASGADIDGKLNFNNSNVNFNNGTGDLKLFGSVANKVASTSSVSLKSTAASTVLMSGPASITVEGIEETGVEFAQITLDVDASVVSSNGDTQTSYSCVMLSQNVTDLGVYVTDGVTTESYNESTGKAICSASVSGTFYFAQITTSTQDAQTDRPEPALFDTKLLYFIFGGIAVVVGLMFVGCCCAKRREKKDTVPINQPAPQMIPPASSSTYHEVECERGSYRTSGDSMDSCIECQPDEKCIKTNNPVSCGAGYYVSWDKLSCKSCESGFVCPDGSYEKREKCIVGTYPNTGTQTCDPCPPGTYGTIDSSSGAECISCPDGTYAPNAHTIGQCLTVPEGYLYNDESSVTACDLGSYTLAGSKSGSPASCTDAPAGTKLTTNRYTDITPCAYGTYNDSTGSTMCYQCPAGKKCHDPAATPSSCSIGEYSLLGDAVCHPCPAGFYCTDPSLAPVPCGVGKYGYKLFAEDISDCKDCPTGMFCPPGTFLLENNAQQGNLHLVEPGSYISSGASVRVMCPENFYFKGTDASQSSDCVACPDGFFCLGGISEPVLCPPGFYCDCGGSSDASCTVSGEVGRKRCTQPSGSDYSFMDNPTFTYPHSGLTSEAGCLLQPDGNVGTDATISFRKCDRRSYYDPTTNSCVWCPAGFLCPRYGGLWTDQPCLPGQYCDAGHVDNSTLLHSCGAGKILNSFYGETSADCIDCPAGYYCPNSGTSSMPQYLSTIVPCPPGYFCPSGSSSTQDCPVGTYNQYYNASSEDDCTACAVGYMCPQNSVSPYGWTLVEIESSIGTILEPKYCTAGYYCPAGSYDDPAGKESCTYGTYGALEGAGSSLDCEQCPIGHKCNTLNMTDPIECLQGTYQDSLGEQSCLECPAGSYCPDDGMSEHYLCPAGEYSSAGATSCSTCDKGHYCPLDGTTSTEHTANKCPAGYLCVDGSAGLDTFPTLKDHACPTGNFCVEATTAPEECPAGKYRPFVGAGSSDDCYDCPAGYYCEAGSSETTGECDIGYYCVAGSSVSNPAAGICGKGTYNPNTGAPSSSYCYPCPAGTTCQSYGMSVPDSCPVGHYCVVRTTDDGSLCPAGTYDRAQLGGMGSVGDCESCPPGEYCSGASGTHHADCGEGYYCSGGSKEYQPSTVQVYGGPCPQGYYCPGGSATPIPCPVGKYGNSERLTQESSCLSCPSSYYCPIGGMDDGYVYKCNAGCYCTGGSDVACQYMVDKGYYSTEGSNSQSNCGPGTYAPEKGMDECLTCPAGYYCPDSVNITPTECGDGRVCAAGSSDNNTKCSAGKVGITPTAENDDDCATCPAGKYCPSGVTLANISGTNYDCISGYICYGGNSSSIGDGKCPAGYYCPSGTSLPIPCAVGTFNDTIGGSNSNACTTCTATYYCSSPAMSSAPTLKCSDGYVCEEGQVVPNPNGTVASGGYVCPEGFMCTEGVKSPCHNGFYQDSEGQSSCLTCPAGYYCPSDATNGIISPTPCDEGYYCQSGSASMQECPVGTYGKTAYLTAESECSDCLAGKYCPNTHMTFTDVDALDCRAGYMCVTGCSNDTCSTGIATKEGGSCPAGSYCIAGSSAGTPCPMGTYNPLTGSVDSNACISCQEGYYCPITGMIIDTDFICPAGYVCNSRCTTANPVDGNSCAASGTCTTEEGSICPVGYACPEGTTMSGLQAFKCSGDSLYSPSTGLSSCLDCPSGYYCAYDSKTICEVGNYCQLGVKTQCSPGTYANNTGTRECLPCPAGYYCPGYEVSNPTDCPVGNYCIQGSDSPTVCPIGTYNPNTLSKSIGACSFCTKGHYCPTSGLSAVDSGLTILGGYFCEYGCADNMGAGRSGAVLFEDYNGGECPIGYYCPAADTDSPIACEEGTYQTTSNQTSCIQCDNGHYCAGIANIAVSGVCEPGFKCEDGAITPTPTEASDGGSLCSKGHYCPNADGIFTEQPCPIGTYGDREGLSECMPCPSGYSCEAEATETPTKCVSGHYCIGYNSYGAATYSDPVACPVGTYGADKTGMTAVDQCEECPPGLACTVEGIEGRSDLQISECEAGYYCGGGSISTQPSDPLDTNNGICPAGTYCDAASDHPIPCSRGTFAALEKNNGGLGCISCTAGHYCADEGMDDVSGECSEGYYCDASAEATSATPKEYICPVGSMCEKATVDHVVCPAGYYTDEVGQSECTECPEGYFCTGGSHRVSCPAGHYCAAGCSSPVKCPDGYYSNGTTGLIDEDQCLPCPVGHYCVFEEDVASEPDCWDESDDYCVSVTTDICDAGYICRSASYTPTPGKLDDPVLSLMPATIGEPCPIGFICSAGCDTPTFCTTTNTWTFTVGCSSEDDCQPCQSGFI
ncbi:uncharacterized protein PTSG_02037, partial [Aduncisulcus paluster]